MSKDRARFVFVVLVFLAVSSAFTATTPPAPSRVSLQAKGDTLRIAVIGDVGEGAGPIASALKLENRRAPLDAIIITGDNVYPCGADTPASLKWQRILQELGAIGIPIFPVLGNHDYGEPSLDQHGAWVRCGKADPDAEMQAAAAKPPWQFPARTYTVSSPIAELAMIDTTPVAMNFTTSFLGSSTAADIAAQIPSLFSQSGTWRIVVGHHSVFSSGYHGLFRRKERASLRRLLLPAFAAAHADLYICGHDHHLELLERGHRGTRMLFLISGAASDPVPPVRLLPSSRYPPDTRPYLGYAVLTLSPISMGIQFFDRKARAKSEMFGFRK